METIGARLKRVRLEKGLSLEEAHRKTKIHMNVLKAIEEDSLVDLSPIYVKGFIKIYCKFLGVEPTENAPVYSRDLRAATGNILNLQKKANIAASLNQTQSSPVVNKPIKAPRIGQEPWPGWKLVKTVAVWLVIVLVLLSLFKLVKNIKFKHHVPAKSVRSAYLSQERHIKSKAPKIEKIKEIVNSPRIASENSSAKSFVSGVNVGILTKEDCFMQVKADGRTVFKGVLKKGRMENWTAKDKLELSLNNAGVVELNINGRVFSNLGKRGQALKNVIIDKEGLNIAR